MKKNICFLLSLLCMAGKVYALTQEELLGTFGAFINDLCEKDEFSGAVLIAHDDTIVFTHACGEASKLKHLPEEAPQVVVIQPLSICSVLPMLC